jgi:hypothetical protein
MTKGNGNRRDFLRTVGTVMVAATVPAAVLAQEKDEVSEDARSTTREQVFQIGYGANPDLPGTYGRARYTLILEAQIGAGGFGSIRDDVYPEVNTHFKITSATRMQTGDERYVYVFIGTTTDSRDPTVTGRITSITVDPSDSSGTCRGKLTIESTPIVDVEFWIRSFSGTYGPVV